MKRNAKGKTELAKKFLQVSLGRIKGKCCKTNQRLKTPHCQSQEPRWESPMRLSAKGQSLIGVGLMLFNSVHQEGEEQVCICSVQGLNLTVLPLKKKVFQKVCESKYGRQNMTKYLTVLKMHDTISLKEVGKQGADLSNFGNEWNLYDSRQYILYLVGNISHRSTSLRL